MRLVRTLVLAAAAAMAAQEASAVPPPPAPVPEELRRPVEGYDLEAVYQRWHYWVEGQKGAAIEALLAEPEEVEGELAFGRPLLRFARHNDYGQYLAGDIRVYCRPDKPYGIIRETCHFRLRRAFVPYEAAGWNGPNPVSRWTQQAFDAAKLVRHFRDLRLDPATDWWRADAAKVFAPLASAVPMLTENATLVRLDSRDCPAMDRAIAAMERATLDWRLDLLGVGEDAKLKAPAPHAIRAVHTLNVITPGGGLATIEAWGDDVNALVAPTLDAADACEAKAKL